MSAKSQFTLLAQYNRLMNQRQYYAAANLSSEELGRDCDAFFKSVLGTLNHILVGDIIWLGRFASVPSSSESLSYIRGLEKPKSLDAILFADFGRLRKEREKVDGIIIDWIAGLAERDLGDCVAYTNMAGKPFRKPFESLVNHLVLHQIHHRGQVTTLLSQFGVDFGDTDLIEIIDECGA